MFPPAHLVLYTIATVLSTWAISLFVRGIKGTIDPSRRRCPACKADLTATPAPTSTPSLACPACDYEAAREQDLFARKRNPWMILASLGALAAAAIAWYFGRRVWDLYINPWDDPSPYDAWVAVSAGLALTGAFIIMQGHRGDRSKGRKRCPKCWYNMTGAPSLTCPECGHRAANARNLYRPRRRRRVMLLGAMVVSLALVPYETSRVLRGGWVAAVPTTALVIGLPWWPQDAVTDGVVTAEEDWSLYNRVINEALWSWQQRMLKVRCRSLVKSSEVDSVDRGLFFFGLFEDDDQVALRQNATIALARILVSDDPLARQKAANALLSLDAYLLADELCRKAALPIVDELTELIRNETDPMTSAAAAALLGSCGEDAINAVPALVDAVHRFPQDQIVGFRTAIALAHLSDDLATARRALIELMQSDDPNIISYAIAGPHIAKNASAYYDELLPLLGHEDTQVARNAAAALRSVTDKIDTTAAAIAAQIDPNGGGRAELVGVLLLFGEAAKPYYPLILAHMASPDQEQRLLATKALWYSAHEMQGDLTPFLIAARSVLNQLSPDYPDYEVHEFVLQAAIRELESSLPRKTNETPDDG